MNQSYRPEVELLLLCTKPERTNVDFGRIGDLVRTDLDWDFLYKLTRRHSLLPLLYHRLQQAAPQPLPAAELQKLRLAYQENVARNLIFTDELVQLTRALAYTGIEAISYKGPVLAVLAYGDPALRRFVDLDLMVRRSDVVPAANVFLQRGYEAAKDLSPDQQALLLNTQHNLQFRRDRDLLVLELHWQVSSHLFASTVTAEELWNNLETVELNHTELKTFSIEDQLFSLCVHGSRHLWERLAWIADIAHLLQARREVEWSTLVKRAEAAKAERMFLLGLHLAGVLFDAPLPDVVKDRIKSDKRIASIASGIIATLFDGPTHHPATASEILKYNVRVRRGWRSRARYLLYTLVPTEGDVELLRLPPAMRFGYYLLRPFRIVSRRQAKNGSVGSSAAR